MKMADYRDAAPTFGARLRYILMAENMSIKKLMRKTGIHGNTISGYLTGRSKPSAKNLTRILEAIPGSYSYWLVTGKES